MILTYFKRDLLIRIEGFAMSIAYLEMQVAAGGQSRVTDASDHLAFFLHIFTSEGADRGKVPVAGSGLVFVLDDHHQAVADFPAREDHPTVL